MKPLAGFDAAVSALPRLPSGSSYRKAAEMMRWSDASDREGEPGPDRCPHKFERDEHCPMCDEPDLDGAAIAAAYLSAPCRGMGGEGGCAHPNGFGHAGDHRPAPKSCAHPRVSSCPVCGTCGECDTGHDDVYCNRSAQSAIPEGF